MRYTDRFSILPGGTPVPTTNTVTLKKRVGDTIVATENPDADGFVTFDISQKLESAALTDPTQRHGDYYATTTVNGETRKVYSAASGWSGNIGAEDMRDGLFGFRTGYLKHLGATVSPGAVSPSSGMILAIGQGSVVNDGQVIHFLASTTVTIEAADATNPRIDALMLRTYRESSAAGANVYAGWYIKKGTPAASPVAPAATVSATITETIAAEITVPAGATAITSGNIVNKLGAAQPTAHTHVIADVTGLQAALDGKAASAHGHAIADVTSLQTSLDGKNGTMRVRNETDSLGWTGPTTLIFQGGLKTHTEALYPNIAYAIADVNALAASLKPDHRSAQVSNIAAQTATYTFTASTGTLTSGVNYKITAWLWVEAYGSTVEAWGRVGVNINGTLVESPIDQHLPQGIHIPKHMMTWDTVLGAGATKAVTAQWRHVSGQYSIRWAKLVLEIVQIS